VSDKWKQGEPIYLQLRDRLRDLILQGVYQEGAAVPSVRQLSADLRINPITVSKSLQLLVDEGWIEKRRGLGMFVCANAQEALTVSQRRHFLEREWPEILSKLALLGLSVDELPTQLPAQRRESKGGGN
jgi:GntR family transcriptional regulator